MAKVRQNKGDLFFDFRHRGQRCREYTKLSDTPANRKKMQMVLDKIEGDIAAGAFDYAKYFPGSKMLEKFVATSAPVPATNSSAAIVIAAARSSTPLFEDFAEAWYGESLPSWRRSHIATMRSTLDRHLIPAFSDKQVCEISKADVLQFRATIAKLSGRNGNTTLSAKTINRVIQILGQIMAEAADRYGFTNPLGKIKRLKQQKVDICPFTIEQVRQIISTIRADYRPYMTVRLFTGMRTAEIHGLKWKYVDFERRQILVRETWVKGQIEYTKTDGSQREIEMSQPVFDALRAQQKVSGKGTFVFCNQQGEILDTDNFTNRVWYPLLRHLDLEKRRPYQTRHTCATLWLGAGENPEWVARQLGHANTMMLFKIYSRFVPNLTRKDGSAFDRFVSGALHPEVAREA